MSLKYARQDPQYVFGPTAVTLTAAYAGNVSAGIPLEAYAEDTIYVEYVPAVGGSTFRLKFEGSPDDYGNYPSPPVPASNPTLITPIYYQETTASVTAGVITHVPAEHVFVGAVMGTTYRIYFYLPPAHEYGRFSIMETSAGAFGTAIVRLLKSGG